MTKYTRITLSERENIYSLIQSGYNQTNIAIQLGRNKSTISRELRRCREDPLGYLPDRANDKAISLMRRDLKLFRSIKLKSYVIDKLTLGWSPEQISGRLRLEGGDMRISHETIYKFVYDEEGSKHTLFHLLPRKKPRRTRWRGRKPKKSHIPYSASISNRPKTIDKRKRIGDWEGDLVVLASVHSDNITTLVERKSRLAKLTPNRGKWTKGVICVIAKCLDAPKRYKKTITFDRGKEFASYKDLGMTTFFCNPHSPWQKGSNENFNGRLRRYFPKGRACTKPYARNARQNSKNNE
ncbi:MAG: IS30 family transposase [Rickettsiaceae bacterium]|nr:IS30 family transposase [Rickettsiaceae bacterium]